MSLADYVPSVTKVNGQMNENVDSPDGECGTDLMAIAIPVDNAIALAAAAAGIISDEKVGSSSSRWEPQSPESISSEVSDHSQAREIVKDSRKISHCLDDHASKASENPVDGFERSYGSCADDQTPEIRACACPRSRTLERLGSSESLFRW